MRTAALVVALTSLVLAEQASAQFVTYYSPVIAPAPVVVAPVPTVAYRPVVPYTSYYAPAPVAVAPAPVVATPVRALAPVVTTRYRPILGGAVSRLRYRYTPGVVLTPLY